MNPLISMVLAAYLAIISLSAQAAPSCPHQLCRLASDKAFDKFVIGRVVRVANDAELKTVFSYARQQGLWQSLPAQFAIYPDTVRLVSIQFSAEQPPVSLFMMRDEFDAAPIQSGDFVRYRPHDLSWEVPKEADKARLFTDLTGCIAVLCSKGDKACMAQYATGIYALNGQAYNLQGQRLAHASPINPDTLKPQLQP